MTIVMVVHSVPVMSSVARADSPAAGRSSDYVVWDGSTTILNWDGTRAIIVQGPVSTPYVAVPGDQETYAATIKNGGPSDATVTVDILNVTTTNQPDTVNTDLEDNVQLFWDINGDSGAMIWRDARLASDDKHVSYSSTFFLGQGDTFPVTVGFHYPSSATGGQSAGGASSVLKFDIRVTMIGDTPNVGAATGGLKVGGVIIPWWALWLGSFMVMAGAVFLVDFLAARRRTSKEQQYETAARTAR